MARKVAALFTALMLAMLAVSPAVGSVARTSRSGVAALAAPTSTVDQAKVPHYFGPYANWANSPLTLPDATVTIDPAPLTSSTVGNALQDRANATDYATLPGTLGPVLVVLPNAAVAADGNLASFEVWNQTVLGSSPNTSEGNIFYAFVLRATANPNEYMVIYASPQLTMPAPTNPAGEIQSFPVSGIVPVLAGDVIGFYGEGIPVDVGGGSDILSYPATANTDGTTPEAPAQGATLSLGVDPLFPFFSQDRTYSFQATIAPAGTGAGAGAAATATVGANGVVTGLTITNPGSGYTTAPTVAITGAGSGAAADAVVQSSGAVTRITVDAPGNGYSAPSAVISGGGASTDATAHVLGGVDDVSLGVQGAGYKFPTVDFDLPDDPNGTVAQGHAVCAAPYPDCNLTVQTDFLTVIGVTVDDPGSGYLTAPGVVVRDGTLFDPINHGGDPFTAASATSTLKVLSVVVDTFGTGYTSDPSVAISDTLAGTGAHAIATTDFGAVTALNLTSGGSGYITPGGIKKFVDTLPGLTEAAANNLGQYIPIAQPDTTTFPDNPATTTVDEGADYYVIAVVQHREQMSSSPSLAGGTLLREYVQLSTSVVPGKGVALRTDLLDGSSTPILMPDGSPALGVDDPHFLGPLIIAKRDRAVRITFYNLLPTGTAGDLFLPTDSSIMGSGMGPMNMTTPINGGSVLDQVRNPTCTEYPKDTNQCFPDNRATLHLHGGVTPWISDGTPHQWITPATEATAYPQGVAVGNVPDMVGASRPAGIPDCSAVNDGCQTFYYTNQQSARLMFYHDHAYGITRLNVYAGEAAGYVITDPVEQKLFGAGGLFPDLGEGTPLIIQDRTFVPSAAQLAGEDPTWDASRWGGMGNLWYHHVYMPAQNPADPTGMRSYGRWFYGPWFWPPATPVNGPIDNPYFGKDSRGPDGIMGVPGSPEAADDFTTPLAKPCTLDDPTSWQYQVEPFCEPRPSPARRTSRQAWSSSTTRRSSTAPSIRPPRSIRSHIASAS